MSCSMVCEICGKTFSLRKNINRHVRVIHKQTDYNKKNLWKKDKSEYIDCPFCEKRFAFKSCLSRHVRKKHTRQDTISSIKTTYVCDICDSSFTSRFKIVKHLKTDHGYLYSTVDSTATSDLMRVLPDKRSYHVQVCKPYASGSFRARFSFSVDSVDECKNWICELAEKNKCEIRKLSVKKNEVNPRLILYRAKYKCAYNQSREERDKLFKRRNRRWKYKYAKCPWYIHIRVIKNETERFLVDVYLNYLHDHRPVKLKATFSNLSFDVMEYSEFTGDVYFPEGSEEQFGCNEDDQTQKKVGCVIDLEDLIGDKSLTRNCVEECQDELLLSSWERFSVPIIQEEEIENFIAAYDDDNDSIDGVKQFYDKNNIPAATVCSNSSVEIVEEEEEMIDYNLPQTIFEYGVAEIDTSNIIDEVSFCSSLPVQVLEEGVDELIFLDDTVARISNASEKNTNDAKQFRSKISDCFDTLVEFTEEKEEEVLPSYLLRNIPDDKIEYYGRYEDEIDVKVFEDTTSICTDLEVITDDDSDVFFNFSPNIRRNSETEIEDLLNRFRVEFAEDIQKRARNSAGLRDAIRSLLESYKRCDTDEKLALACRTFGKYDYFMNNNK